MKVATLNVKLKFKQGENEMSNLENYQNKLEAFSAIPDDQIVTLTNIPVGTCIQEAERLYHWCREDQEELTGKGLSWELVEDLPVRSGALMEAESRWNARRYSRKEAGERWTSESLEAYELRNVMLHEFRFAYRNDEWLSGRVRVIAQGSGHADMLQDLNDLSVLGKENPAPLTAIHFDMTLLDRAAQLADEKSALWAKASVDRAGYKEAKKIRDQAFSHLKEAVDEIREYGRHVFWRNETRLIGYRSEYLHKMKRNRKNGGSGENNRESPEAGGNFPADNDSNGV